MRNIFANPIFISFGCLAGLVLAIVFALGGNLGEAATLVFTPYFSDTHLSVSEAGKRFLQVVPAIAQLSILVLIFLRSRLNKKFARASVSIFGVILVLCYFLFLISVQLIDSVH